MPNDSDRPFAIGDTIAGKYRIEHVLGEGGMGVVAAATHLNLQQLVAIKFVLPSMLESKVVVERFLREARATVRLKSEHAARVIDVDTLASGVPYMVMEYLEGSDLAQVLRTRGRLPVEAAADYVVQACEAVAEAHARGIVHRDLKPQNLFLTTGLDGEAHIKVLDFGISKMADDYTSGLTNPHVMMGSPQYMAPEQMRGSRGVDGRADIWALGVVLYRLLANELPFGSGSMPEICMRVLNEPARPLARAVPDAPERLVAIVERCLEKNPAHRFPTAGELASALELFAPSSARVAAKRARAADAGRASMLSIPPVHKDAAPTPSEGIVSTPHPAARESAESSQGPFLAGGGARKGAWAGGRSLLLVVAAALVIATVAAVSRRSSPLRPKASAADSPPAVAAAVNTAVVQVTAASVQSGAPGAPETVGLPSLTFPPPGPAKAASVAPPPEVSLATSVPAASRPADTPARARPAASPGTAPTVPGKAKPAASAGIDDDIPSLR